MNLTTEQIQDIFEEELKKAGPHCFVQRDIDVFDGRYDTAETAMLETVKRVLEAIKEWQTLTKR